MIWGTLLVLCLATQALAFSFTFGPTCGQTPVKPNISIKIVGGTPAITSSWPWQILLVNSKINVMCGGSIIDKNWILTAGHCVEGNVSHPEYFNVYAGTSMSHQLPSPIKVKRIYIHPNYGSLSGYSTGVPENDVALLQLATSLTYSNSIQHVCLPSYNDSIPDYAVATGWGYTNEYGYGGPSNELRQVKLPLVSDMSCLRSYGILFNWNTMICAGQAGKDTCQGDSGGPLVAKRSDGSWYQLGVTSWGIGCGSNDPGVYARVLHFCSFISNTTNNDVTCSVCGLSICVSCMVFAIVVSIFDRL